MIQLFDSYNQKTQDLHASLQAAGFTGTTIVIEPDGFLPEGVISPFLYFLENASTDQYGLYFNQIKIPEFWEIVSTSQDAKILNMGEEKGRIYYVDQSLEKIVKRVDWLDKNGQVVLTDHYDKYANRFAQTSYQAGIGALLTTYFSKDQKERIVENHCTGNIILNLENEPTKIFKHRTDFLIYFFQYLHVDLDTIFYNSLSTPFFLSMALSKKKGRDLLFWQEPIYHEIPGNMKFLLEDDTIRTQHILVPDMMNYTRMKQLIPPKYHEKLVNIGYYYTFLRENHLRKEALILTYSDKIEQLERLVQLLPMMTFRIAALTEMSSKLSTMRNYANVRLYPNATVQQLKELFQKVDVYLDINHGKQVLQAVRQAFEQNILVLGFQETIHDHSYIAKRHIFSSKEPEKMAYYIQYTLSAREIMETALIAQREQAGHIEKDNYEKQINHLLDATSHEV